MAETSISCSVSQGFNFQKDSQEDVGHITALKIGDKEFAADLAVTDPENVSGDKVKVVGVMSGIFWNGGFAEGVNFSCQISVANKTEASVLTHSELSNTNVEFQFNAYKFDPVEKKYYKAFHANDTALEGIIEKTGDTLNIRVSEEAGYEVTNPGNYDLSLGVMPEEKEQSIHLAFSVQAKQAKGWGVQVG
ncbi:MAG: hypothetical protein MI742_07345 [Desulfobacterales bacterium]|nr:hypothetical protein [Desulfobacterales bacterium]